MDISMNTQIFGGERFSGGDAQRCCGMLHLALVKPLRQ